MVNSRAGGVTLVVGEDVGVVYILELEGRTLISKFIGRRVSLSSVHKWL